VGKKRKQDLPGVFAKIKKKKCRACHGSGKKSSGPCPICGGTGMLKSAKLKIID